LTACSESTTEHNIEAFVKDYKTKQYTINDLTQLAGKHPVEINAIFTEKLESYLSEDELENLTINRFFLVTPNVAIAANKKVKLETISLEKVEDNEDGSINYNYTLEIDYYDDQSSEIIEKEGQLTILVNDDELKITRDWEKMTQFEEEVLSRSH
jgi:ribosomal protein L20A (L18A)